MDSFRNRLRSGEMLLGTFITLPYPEIAEILAAAGVDWLFIDMEHGPMTLENTLRILQASEGRCPCLVRVPANNETWIQRVLDLGPAGIIVPHVDSAREAAEMLEWALFPPQGVRSVGVSRALGYGNRLLERLKTANEELLVIPQVEHIDAARAIEDIVGLPGLQAVFVGPFDLSGSLKKPGEIDHPEVTAEVEKIGRVCQKARKTAGIFAADPAFALKSAGLGYTLIDVGADTLFLSRAAGETVAALRASLGLD